MGRCNNKRTQAAALAMRNTPARSRFSKGPPGRGNNNKQQQHKGDFAGRGGGGGGRGNAQQHARVIDKIQHRVDPQHSTAATTVTPDVASTSESLRYLDKTKLDEIVLSEKTQALMESLLKDLGVVEKSSSDDVNEEEASEEEGHDQDECDEDYVDDDVLLEQSDARRVSNIRQDFLDDDDDDEELVTAYAATRAEREKDEEAFQSNDAQQEETPAKDDNDEFLKDHKAFLHLTQQLSFTHDQAARACRAIDGWEEAVALTDTETTCKGDKKKSNNELELAMDWLCLHLSEDDLKRGFRPNPDPPKQHSNDNPASKTAIKVKAIPHPSISISSKPIAEQAKEWARSLRLQERTVALVRLGFHHAEALQACDETAGGNDNRDEAAASCEFDPAVPLLLTKLRNEVLPDFEEIGADAAEELEMALEEQTQELEALQAIYDDQLEIIHGKNSADDTTLQSVDRYVIAIKPVQPLPSPARSNDCRLHVLLQDGYPHRTIPLLMLVNESLPPTFLRRINSLLHQKAQELLGTPAVFETVSFLENDLFDHYSTFLREQRRKEFEAEQVRLLRQRKAEMEEAERIMDMQYHAQYDPNGEGSKVGRRQRAKLKAAEKAYDRPDQMEELNKEYRRRQDARVEDAQTQNAQVRATYAQLAIARRQQERIQEEAEMAARSAMSASLNRGDGVETAREVAQRARYRVLQEHGIKVPGDGGEKGTDAIIGEPKKKEDTLDGNQPADDVQNKNPTTKSSQFMDRLRNSVGESTVNEPSSMKEPKAKGPTQQTSAFMDRLRAMYDNAVQDKLKKKTDTKSTNKSSALKLECYHLENSKAQKEAGDRNDSSVFNIPHPVAVPAGELVEVMKDIIDQQEDQPWLVAEEARAPILGSTRHILSEKHHKRESEISKRLREDLERKRRLALEWACQSAATSSKTDSGKKQKGNDAFSPEKYHHLMNVRQSLPAYKMENKIINAIQSNQITVIAGETGSGKTTQVPQLVMDHMILSGQGANANMIVTQPRRISAIGVAERVADERGERVGGTVGYSIKLEKRMSRQTRLLLCTTGVLLRRLQCDPDLASISHVFVDEVHERDLNTDFLIIILKDLLGRRKDLKLVLMSATLNAESFSKYFGGCPVVSIPGRTFPVQEFRLEDVLDLTGHQIEEGGDYVQKTSENKPPKISKSAVRRLYYPKYSKETIHSLSIVDETIINYPLIADLLEHISKNEGEGAILVFCPGFQEIQKTIEEMYKKEYFQSGNVVIYPLHSTLSTAEQTAIFEIPSSGVRKIVVSTNIAETSITIEDVVFVVDTGRVKENRRDEVNETPTLEETWCSRASSRQRRGRAGRVQPGIAYHLYSSHTHDSDLQDYQLPEILRVGIEDLVLQILILDLGDPISFLKRALDPPSDLALSNSLKLLEQLGAVECTWKSSKKPRAIGSSGDDPESDLEVPSELTALGFHLASLPVDPRVGKMMIYGALFGCTDPLLTLAASMSARSPFVSPFDQREQADQARKKFAEGSSDHLTILNAFNQWSELKKSQGNRAVVLFLKENFLGRMTLKQMEDLRKQFHSLLTDIGFLPQNFQLNDKEHAANANSSNKGLLNAALCAGLYPNILVAPKSAVSSAPPKPSDKKMGETALRSHTKGDVYLHPSTVAFEASRLDSRYCCYYELVRTSKTYVRDCTPVSPFALLLFGGSLQVYQTHGVCSIDGWLKFRIDAKPATLIKYLRSKMERLLFEKIVAPEKDIMGTVESKALINSISLLFESEASEQRPIPETIPDRSGGEIVRPYNINEDRNSRSAGRAGRGRGGHGGRGRGRSSRGDSDRRRGN